MKPILQTRLPQIKNICGKHQVKRLWAFGSVTEESFSEKSDVDLLVEFEDMDLMDYADNYFDLQSAFESIFKRKIDLVTTNSLANPYFIRAVERQKVLLYG